MADQKLSQQTQQNEVDGSEFVHIITENEVSGSTESFKSKVNDLGLVSTVDTLTGNAILEGGIIFLGGLDYYVWAKRFIIGNVVYGIDVNDTITLSNGDGSNPRIDTFVVTINPVPKITTAIVEVLEGTPAASPVQDSIDLSTQAQISFRLVAQSETTDPTTTQELIYNEATGVTAEWNSTSIPSGADLEDTTDPYNGTKSFITPATASAAAIWTDTTSHTFDSTDNLNFAYRIASTAGSGKRPRLQIKLIDSASGKYWIRTTSVKSTSTSWELKSINLSKFALQPTKVVPTTYDRIEITFINTPIVELDWINIQGEIDQPTVLLEPIAVANTGSRINLSNYYGAYCNMASANANTTYEYHSEVLGGFSRVLINAASEPSVTGATKIFGSTFLISTNMYMTLHYNGNRVEYWFEKI